FRAQAFGPRPNNGEPVFVMPIAVVLMLDEYRPDTPDVGDPFSSPLSGGARVRDGAKPLGGHRPHATDVGDPGVPHYRAEPLDEMG
ncbi:MAG: hypothetical protein LC772_05730, partial [Chloroflexi bacterium]|nr:hypothetical protein [Chloroflexota bacterium]